VNISQQQKSRNRILSNEQISAVNEYALRLIEEIGCKVQCEEAREILGHAGCDVKDPNRIRIPRKLVTEAIDASPKQIEVFNRGGELAMMLVEDQCYYGTGSDCPSTIDLNTGAHRTSTKEDVGNFARFCDALPHIDFVMSFGIAQDITRGMDFVHGYEAMLLNTSKPAIVTGHGRNDMTTMIRMAASVRYSYSELCAKPCLILYTEPMSPMIHTEMGISKGLVCCEYGIPFIYIGSPMMGVNGPATIEGTLVQTVAECLSGLVIFQLKQPGAKFIFGGDATVMDMSTTIFSYGAPELNILNACLADMAHYYHLPFFCIAGATDSKVLDAQAGLEYAFSILDATLNGCNLIHDCGYLESGLTSSFESVLFADEVISLVKYMLRPLEFNNESVPFDIMDKVGPGGSFLGETHTLHNYRKRFWFPRYLDRRNYERWAANGGKDLRQVLNIKAKEIFEQHRPQNLPDNVIRQIEDAILAHKPDLS
jgi:trimethylamine--corrinoid protein Co-methyltransferase